MNTEILYENGNHWVCKAKNGYEVYRVEGTHSVRCAIIGYEGPEGFIKAKNECDRRQSAK